MAVGLAVISRTLVDVLLPDQWSGVAPFLSVLAAVSIFRPINGFISQYLISIERNQRLMWMEAMRVVVLFGGLVLLGLAGPIAAAFAIGLAAFAHTIGLLQSIHGDGQFLKSLLSRLRAPVLSCIMMAVAVLGMRWLVGPTDGLREGMLLAAEIVLGAVSYAVAMLIFGRMATLEVLSLLRDALQRRGAA
jgi:O-antigen/teichoic acid export membrane protein